MRLAYQILVKSLPLILMAGSAPGLMFAAVVIMFSWVNDRLDSDFPQIFLNLHFITTPLNNRRQLNDNDLRPNSIC